MKLTLEQERVLHNWIHKKVEHHICQLCQSNHWRIGELLLSPDRDPGNHSTSSMVQLICGNCGQVLLFDVSRIAEWHSVDTTSDLM